MPSVCSLFSGIGGIDLGFIQAGFDIVWANEMDAAACRTYRHNFPNTNLIEGDIKRIATSDIPDCDVLTAGFPCQPFSIAGLQKGFKDRDGNLFFEITRIIDAKRPKVVFLENVPKAGFFCFFKVWRDMPYDAVLDYEHILYRVEVKGSSSGTYNLTRGGRSGAQIDRHAENRTRRIERSDCDFVVCVDSNNGDCYKLPVDILDITNRKNFGTRALEPFKEKWQLFIHDDATRLTGSQTRDGLLSLPLPVLQSVAMRIGAIVPTGDFRLPGTTGLRISDEKEKTILAIWYKLCE